MEKNNLKCIVTFGDTKKQMIALSYDDLVEKIQSRFNLRSGFFEIFEDSCIMENDYFQDCLSTQITEINLTIKPKIQKYTLFCNILNEGLQNTRRMEVSIPSHSKLKDLSNYILTTQNIDNFNYICSFYSEEGQPLVCYLIMNSYMKIKDVLSDGSVLYVYIVRYLEGKNEIKPVNYDRNDSFSVEKLKSNNNSETTEIKINIQMDSKESIEHLIAEKKSLHPYSIRVYRFEDIKRSYQDKRIIQYSLVNFQENPYFTEVPFENVQTEKGIRLLNGLLKCLPHHLKNYEIKLVSCLRYLSNNCKPFLYAIFQRSKNNSLLQTEKIAIQEGIISCFKNICMNLNIEIESNRLGECSLEFFALLFEICNSKGFTSDEDEKIEQYSINCELSNEKLKEPIKIERNDGSVFYCNESELKKYQDNTKVIRDVSKDLSEFSKDYNMKLRLKMLNNSSKAEVVVMKTVINNDYDIYTYIKKLGLTSLEKMREKINCNTLTKITSYLEIELAVKKFTLFLDKKQVLWINYGLQPCSNNLILLENSLTGEKLTIESSSLVCEESLLSNPEHQLPFTRKPIEAISILVDASGSMLEPFYGMDINRMEAATAFFFAFAQRTIAYNYNHVISLYTFSKTLHKICGFMENVKLFCKKLENIEIKGATSLWDSIITASDDLLLIKRDYSDIKLRIICLSDGEDNSSALTYENANEKLSASNITLDSIVLGNQSNKLKSLSLATGGFSFQCLTIESGYSLFESDAFLSLSFRKKVTQDHELANYADYSFTSIPPPIEYPANINSKVQNIKKTLVKVSVANPKIL